MDASIAVMAVVAAALVALVTPRVWFLLGPILVCGVAVLGWVVIGIGVVGVKEKEKEIFVGKGSTSKWLCLCLSEMVLGLVLGWLSRVVDG